MRGRVGWVYASMVSYQQKYGVKPTYLVCSPEFYRYLITDTAMAFGLPKSLVAPGSAILGMAVELADVGDEFFLGVKK